MKKTLLLLCILASSIVAHAQNEDIESVNHYIDYTNESIHGILVIHRLLENFNKDINLYVDLDSKKINKYTNKQLEDNVFTTQSFYEITPEELYQTAVSSEGAPISLPIECAFIKSINDSLNHLRFVLEESVNKYDLSKGENLGRVYEQLEQGQRYYNKFFDHYRTIYDVSQNYRTDLSENDPELVKTLKELYRSMRDILLFIRGNTEGRTQDRLDRMDITMTKLNGLKDASNDETVQESYNNIMINAREFIRKTKLFLGSDKYPKEYKLYGKYYYYYNTDLITKFNWYGQGVVRDINTIIDIMGNNKVHLLELPHYFKVVYPKKKEKIGKVETKTAEVKTKVELPERKPQPKETVTEEVVEAKPKAKTKKIVSIPKTVKKRKVRKSKKVIKSSELTLQLHLYDDLIVDGDTISINFNDQWVVEKQALTRKPITVDLELNPEGSNYLLLHAHNVGRRPPNTMLIKYKYFGLDREVILHSDMKTSELIELEYVRGKK